MFVDSWGWIALFNKHDPYYRVVLPAFDRLLRSGRSLFLTNAVLYEALQTTQRYYGKPALADFGGKMFDAIGRKWAILLRADDALEATAWSLQLKFADQDVSFTDCLSFAMMQRHGITTAFTGDTHFTLLGFNIIPDISR